VRSKHIHKYQIKINLSEIVSGEIRVDQVVGSISPCGSGWRVCSAHQGLQGVPMGRPRTVVRQYFLPSGPTTLK
jgi:hypothetical protein